jgi:hypothetical protein
MMKNGEFKSVKENENPLSVDAKVFYLKKMLLAQHKQSSLVLQFQTPSLEQISPL